MRVRLSEIGMEEFRFATAYEEFVIGWPVFEVEAHNLCCYLHRPTGCTFMEDEIEPFEESRRE